MNLFVKIIILVGCYQDSITPRLLTRSIAKVNIDDSKDKCLRSCRWQRYPLAGLHNTMCSCGDSSIDDLKKFQVNEEQCNQKCPGGSSSDCSGNLTMMIYHTGSLSTDNTFTVPSTLQDPGKHLFQIN